MRYQFSDALLFQNSHFFPLVGLPLVGQGLKAPQLIVSKSTTDSGLLVSLIPVLLYVSQSSIFILPVVGHSSCFTGAHSLQMCTLYTQSNPTSLGSDRSAFQNRVKCSILKILGAYTFPFKVELPRLHTTISTQGTRDPVPKKLQISKRLRSYV